jgi:hypothetical protein
MDFPSMAGDDNPKGRRFLKSKWLRIGPTGSNVEPVVS